MISLLCTPGGQVERGRPKTERFGVVLGLFSHLLGPSGCSIRAGGSPPVTLQRLPGWPCPQGMLSTRSCSSHPSFRWPQSRIFLPVRPQSWIFLLPALPQSRIFLPAPQRAPRRRFQAQKHRRGVAKSWFSTTTRENREKTGRKRAGNWSQSDLQPLRTPGSMDLGSRMRGVIGFWWRIRGWRGEEGSEHQDPGLGSWEEHGAKTSYLGCAMGPHRAARSVSDGWARWERGYRGLGGHH